MDVVDTEACRRLSRAVVSSATRPGACVACVWRIQCGLARRSFSARGAWSASMALAASRKNRRIIIPRATGGTSGLSVTDATTGRESDVCACALNRRTVSTARDDCTEQDCLTRTPRGQSVCGRRQPPLKRAFIFDDRMKCATEGHTSSNFWPNQ
jgi:hypothetical protein